MKLALLKRSQPIYAEYFLRIRKHDDELGITLKGHLLVEYLINKIIEAKCKSPKKILENSKTYSFSVKTQLLYAMDFLPEYLNKNISKLNNIRNELAHNLNFSEQKIDNVFYAKGGGVKKIKKLSGKYPHRSFLKFFCWFILGELAAHIEKNLGIPSEIEESILVKKYPLAFKQASV